MYEIINNFNRNTEIQTFLFILIISYNIFKF